MPKGFQQIQVKTRTFEVELKHRPPDDMTGDREELIKTEKMHIPDLGNREWEKRWAMMTVWNMFSSEEAKQLGVNQVFVFSKGFRELIFRIELNLFEDEEAHKLDVPSQKQYDDWLTQVRKKIKKMYGLEIDDWVKSGQITAPVDG